MQHATIPRHPQSRLFGKMLIDRKQAELLAKHIDGYLLTLTEKAALAELLTELKGFTGESR